jgi:hypothetical protein
MTRVLIGTADGVFEIGRSTPVGLAGQEVTGLVRENGSLWAIVGGQSVWRRDPEGDFVEVTRTTGEQITCLLPLADRLLVGSAGAHLAIVADGQLLPVVAFEDAPTREGWHTPWGGPADARSLARSGAGALLVNVHVGGVLRALSADSPWSATIDLHADVHQVIAGADFPSGLSLLAAAVGLGVSTDDGSTWRIETDGLHARYCRAVALADDTVLVSASTGPRSQKGALYRRPLAGGSEPLSRCEKGLPEWVPGNIDTGCLAASGSVAAFAAPDGAVFVSDDAGASWEQEAMGLRAPRAVVVA